MSPYRAKFDEKRCMLCLLTSSLFLNIGSPILSPKAFDSFDRAMTHPSLFESTATGLFSRCGLNTRSHEA